MIAQELLQGQREKLIAIIRSSFGHNRHSDAFAVRVLGLSHLQQIISGFQLKLPTNPDEIAYQGFPGVAYLGFGLGTETTLAPEVIDCFVAGLKRLQQRPETSLASFALDDVALLGVADGIARLINSQTSVEIIQMRNWLIQLVDKTAVSQQWSSRMRALAGDLLDKRGRLRVLPDNTNMDTLALELVLRNTWPHAYIDAPNSTNNQHEALLEMLLTQTPPQTGDLERAIVWLKALDLIIDYACQSLFPSVSDTARILASVQYSLKRWRWKEQSSRRNAMPSRWLIDDEFDVQALLWAVLYSIYDSELVDETYLPNWGNVQPRADLGIVKLKLIIEVKIAREPADFAKIEEQVAGDLGLYFKDTNLFDRMIVFVYDDCDKHQPEKYASLRNALMKRDRIEDVIIIRRPSMIPDRNKRNQQ